MQSNIIGNFHLTICLAVLFILPTCIAGDANLARDGQVTIQIESPLKSTLAVSGIYQEEEFVEISGRVWRHSLSFGVLYTGHVDVRISDPDGTVASVSDVPCYPRDIKKGSRNSATFSTRIKTQMNLGTVVRLRFHRGNHGNVANAPFGSNSIWAEDR